MKKPDIHEHTSSLILKSNRVAIYYIAALALGTLLGLVANEEIYGAATFIGTIFTRLFSFVAVPVIALALVSTLAKLGTSRKSGAIFGHTIFYTLLTTVISAVVALTLYVTLAPENVPSDIAGTAMVPESLQEESYLHHILSVIPSNILQPFVSGNVLSVLIVAALFGFAIAAQPEGRRKELMISLVFAGQDLLFTLIRWLIAVLPLGVIAFTTQLVHELGHGVQLGGLATYFTVVIGANLTQLLVVLPLLLLLRGINPLRIFRGMAPALMLALFSKSSAGTLPVTISCAEDNLRVDRRVSRFVLPICTTINMNGCAAFILATSLYLMQNAGVTLDATTLLTWIVIATVAAIGNAGVPMGCYFMTLSLVSSMGVPVQLMGVILPVYAVIDMIETSLNVWSDSCVCNIVNKDLGPSLGEEA
ncbi:MAG: dicarboxylate/amino acid:cation symporter [Succinivibrionaceae bacterium]|nr:dicarboxylate/amino acid:cation symporter [Succinivibrionaceae bacterium]